MLEIAHFTTGLHIVSQTRITRSYRCFEDFFDVFHQQLHFFFTKTAGFACGVDVAAEQALARIDTLPILTDITPLNDGSSYTESKEELLIY
jgi:hypothetical protein